MCDVVQILDVADDLKGLIISEVEDLLSYTTNPAVVQLVRQD